VDLKFADAMDKVAVRAHVGLYEDETAARCHWHIPETHFLEAWSDVRSADGTVTIMQPLIAPLYGGKSAHEVIAAIGPTGERSGYDLVREHWMAQSGLAGPGGAPRIRVSGARRQRPRRTRPPRRARACACGSCTGSAGAPGRHASRWCCACGESGSRDVQPRASAVTVRHGMASLVERRVHARHRLPADDRVAARRLRVRRGGIILRTGLEVLFRPDPSVYDGRFANNAWLQELPKSMTKMTWDNPALIAPGTAMRLNLASGDVVELRQGGRTLRIPVWIAPGHAQDTLTLSAGYGRTRAGRAGNNTGFNSNALRTSTAPDILTGVELVKTGETYDLACTQDHWSLEGRNLVRVATIDNYSEDPQFAQKMEQEPLTGITMYQDFKYEGYAWGMAIDQNVCTGCNSCVVACQAENNVPGGRQRGRC
jgi:molybdopterin-containing oxidoreductase family iron-sulfur binding subunit